MQRCRVEIRGNMRRLPSGMVPLPEATRMACLQAGLSGAISDERRNAMATRLREFLTIYVVGEEAGQITMRALTHEEAQGGVFSDGARSDSFSYGRPSFYGLAVTDASLIAALRTLK